MADHKRRHTRGRRPTTDEVVETKLQSDYWDHDIKPSEAAPAFGGMLCCLVLVPFGVLAPLFFLVDGPTVLLLNKSRLMGALVLAVFVFVTVLTTAANASMDRIKTEKKSKLAGHALRLALRAQQCYRGRELRPPVI